MSAIISRDVCHPGLVIFTTRYLAMPGVTQTYRFVTLKYADIIAINADLKEFLYCAHPSITY